MATTEWSRSPTSSEQNQQGYTVTESPRSTTGSTQQSGATSENASLFETQDMQTIRSLIASLQKQYTKQAASQQQNKAVIEGLMMDYSKGNAFEDAKGLMALNLQKALETGNAAINRSIEGAGTSASSMQGLLAQKLAGDSALQASALGAHQAGQYGQILVNLVSLLEKDDQSGQTLQGLLNALNILKGGIASKTATSTQTGSSSQMQSGGTKTVSMDGNNAKQTGLLTANGSATPGNQLLTLGSQYGYAGDLGEFASLSSSGQSTYDYTKDLLT